MSDTLEIFGTEYTGVTGIKATDDNNNTKTYIRPQGTKSITANGSDIDVAEYAFANVSVDSNEFIVTISWDDDYFGQDDGAWIPDMTYAQIQSAYNAGKEIAVISGGEATADGGWNSDNSQFLYVVQSFGENPAYYFYILSANGIELDETYEYIVPRFQTVTKTYTPTTSQQTETVTYSSSYNGLQEVDITVNAMPSGTAGTPSASKGTVSNHSVSVTPSVTNTTGYITGSTKTGTAVTVSASELVSGSQTLSDNGDYDVTNLASVTVSVSGGGGSSMTVGTKTTTLNSASSTISFTGLSGNPLAFAVTSSADQSTGGTTAVAVAYDGTSLHGMDITTQAENDTGFTKSYSSGTLTITATTATFGANAYKLVYAYGGSSSDIHTEDVQVGSGATSITFSGLSGRPLYFSCVFKSTFSTSSGYQRVMDVVNDGTNTYGNALDSSAKALTSWSYSYSGGSLTISSTGTNNGGYFHQPGYYQLTYAVDPNAINLQNKTNVSATTSSQTITADNGYDGLESVQINAISQTNLTASNIKSGTTISISNGSTNLWSVTGTYDGGGGGDSKNVQIYSGRDEVNTTSYTETDVTLTVSKAGTYKCYWSMDRNTTSGTNGSQLYKNGSAVGSVHTTWTHNGASCTETLTFAKNDVLVVRARARNTSYYCGVSNLVIIEQ